MQHFPPIFDVVPLKDVKHIVSLLSHLSNFGYSHDTYCRLAIHSKYVKENKELSGLKTACLRNVHQLLSRTYVTILWSVTPLDVNKIVPLAPWKCFYLAK